MHVTSTWNISQLLKVKLKAYLQKEKPKGHTFESLLIVHKWTKQVPTGRGICGLSWQHFPNTALSWRRGWEMLGQSEAYWTIDQAARTSCLMESDNQLFGGGGSQRMLQWNLKFLLQTKIFKFIKYSLKYLLTNMRYSTAFEMFALCAINPGSIPDGASPGMNLIHRAQSRESACITKCGQKKKNSS